jgi:hypothetical protein
MSRYFWPNLGEFFLNIYRLSKPEAKNRNRSMAQPRSGFHHLRGANFFINFDHGGQPSSMRFGHKFSPNRKVTSTTYGAGIFFIYFNRRKVSIKFRIGFPSLKLGP